MQPPIETQNKTEDMLGNIRSKNTPSIGEHHAGIPPLRLENLLYSGKGRLHPAAVHGASQYLRGQITPENYICLRSPFQRLFLGKSCEHSGACSLLNQSKIRIPKSLPG